MCAAEEGRLVPFAKGKKIPLADFLNESDDRGMTAFHLATSMGYLVQVKEVLPKEERPTLKQLWECRDNSDSSIIHTAARNGGLAILTTLIKDEERPSVEQCLEISENGSNSVFHDAAKFGCLADVMPILPEGQYPSLAQLTTIENGKGETVSDLLKSERELKYLLDVVPPKEHSDALMHILDREEKSVLYTDNFLDKLERTKSLSIASLTRYKKDAPDSFWKPSRTPRLNKMLHRAHKNTGATLAPPTALAKGKTDR